MRRHLLVLAMTIVCGAARADMATVNRARNSLSDLLTTATDLSKEAQRDAEVLRLLREASRSLDDFQQNVAISKALDNIGKAEQLAGRPPFSARVQRAAQIARAIVEPAKTSTMNLDLSKMRNDLQARPIEMMRGIVAEEVTLLAQLATQVSDVSGILTKAVAAATATTAGTKSE